jgi:hypothetical protein
MEKLRKIFKLCQRKKEGKKERKKDVIALLERKGKG